MSPQDYVGKLVRVKYAKIDRYRYVEAIGKVVKIAKVTGGKRLRLGLLVKFYPTIHHSKPIHNWFYVSDCQIATSDNTSPVWLEREKKRLGA